MKNKYNQVNPFRLRCAKIKLFLYYSHLCLIALSFFAGMVAFNMIFRNTLGMSVLFNKNDIYGSLILLSFIPVYFVTKVFLNWKNYVTKYKAHKILTLFRRNLAEIVRDQYGYVTESNVDAVRSIAKTMYFGMTGNTMMYNQISYGDSDFFNAMILTKAEQLAIYGRTLGFKNSGLITI